MKKHYFINPKYVTGATFVQIWPEFATKITKSKKVEPSIRTTISCSRVWTP